MNKITVLKIDLNDGWSEATIVEDLDLIKENLVEITDKEIENEAATQRSIRSVNKNNFEEAFLSCWEYIKSRINQ